MKKIFTLAAVLMASISLWATAVANLNFNEPTELPSGYVYSAANTPVIATVSGKSAVYVTNGGGGQVTAACFADGAPVASQGKRWMGFVTDTESSVVITVLSGKKTFTLYNSEGTAQATFTNTASSTWEEWTIDALPAGAYILSAGNSQCYVASMAFTGGAPSTDPVESVSVKGPTTGFVGIPVTLTATAAKADTIWWTDKYGTVQESLNGVFTFTPSAEGEVTYTAWAQNAYNVNPATQSHTITISGKLCGELIKATHVNKNTATVTGAMGGTADKNTQDNGKLGSNGHYFGIRLASGDFMPGDSVTIIASALNGGNVATIYSDKGTNLLATVDFDAESLTATYTLTQTVSAIYVYRTSSACNPNIESIAVNRSCEASNNANVAEVRVNDVVVEPDGANGTLYNYTLSATYNEPTVSIALTLAHPLATIKYGLANPYQMSTPEAGNSRGQAFTIIAEDGVTEKTITVNVSKSASLSDDWMLSALSIDGYTLDPAFTPEVNEYSITKPYGAANPEESAIHATPRHPGAHVDHITLNPTNILVVVVAEDGVASNGYLINILEAQAKKDLLEATFSNGVHGFILNGNIDVPYLAGEAEPTFVSARFWNPDGEPTYAMVDGKLVVTGIDGLTASYTITYVPLTPMAANYEEITFDTVPSYVYSVYGWDASKGLKFSKDVEEATNHRISEGKDRIYLALPAAENIILTSGSGANRPVEVVTNGHVVQMDIKTPASGESFAFQLDPTKPNFVGIESKGNSGDAGFTKMQLTAPFPTAIGNTEVENTAVKMIENGQLIIIKNGLKYNAQGACLR